MVGQLLAGRGQQLHGLDDLVLLLAREVGERAEELVEPGDTGVERPLLGEQGLAHRCRRPQDAHHVVVLGSQRADDALKLLQRVVEGVRLGGDGLADLRHTAGDARKGAAVAFERRAQLVHEPAQGLRVDLTHHAIGLVGEVRHFGGHLRALEGDAGAALELGPGARPHR